MGSKTTTLLLLVGDLAHLAKAMPSSRQGVLELENFDLFGAKKKSMGQLGVLVGKKRRFCWR